MRERERAAIGGPRFWAIISLRPLTGVAHRSRFTERSAQTGPDSWDDWAAQPKNGGCGSGGGAIKIASSTSIVRLFTQSASDEKPNGAEGTTNTTTIRFSPSRPHWSALFVYVGMFTTP